MDGPFAMFYDPVSKHDIAINARWVTHVYPNPKSKDPKAGLPETCIVVMGGNSLMLTVQGDIVDVYKQLRDAVGQTGLGLGLE